MQALYELLPLILFFASYKLAGIFVATAVLMVVSTLQLAIAWFRTRKLETMPLITVILALILGGITLALHDDVFIKWKFSIVEWLFGAVFVGTNLVGTRPLIQRIFTGRLDLPDRVWRRLNLMWGGFFLVLGTVNVYVIYHFDTAVWMNFKFYGVLAATLLFIILQAIYVGRHMDVQESE